MRCSSPASSTVHGGTRRAVTCTRGRRWTCGNAVQRTLNPRVRGSSPGRRTPAHARDCLISAMLSRQACSIAGGRLPRLPLSGSRPPRLGALPTLASHAIGFADPGPREPLTSFRACEKDSLTRTGRRRSPSYGSSWICNRRGGEWSKGWQGVFEPVRGCNSHLSRIGDGLESRRPGMGVWRRGS